jgi:uncharacterized protein (TIGR02680 family)
MSDTAGSAGTVDPGLSQDHLFARPADGPRSSADLPAAPAGRFQPLRAGILNLWQYDEQELRFHGGRLLLRGENGAGKSKALEVLLPFLLDADLSPQRLDPFGGTSRSMEWNLLQGGRYESRVGYVWLELGRRAAPEEVEKEGGEEVFWTLGCGLRASQRTRRVDSWYFLTRLRVGDGLALVTAQRTPLLKDQLRQQLGSDGWVFETGREYREKLDAQIFGLGPERFAALRHLLLQLRRPHLSERLDPDTLSEFLKESLPPLDADLIGQLSEGFERLDNDHKELVRTDAAVKDVTSFLDLYRDYGRGIARGRAAEVRQADSRYHKTAAEVREAEEEEARLSVRVGELAAAGEELDRSIAGCRGALRALEQSEAMRSAEVLRDKREQARGRSEQAARERDDAGREERAAAERRGELESAEGAVRAAADLREESARGSAAAAREAGLEAAEEAARAALAERPAAAEATLRAALRRREDEVGALRGLAGERDRARLAAERAADRLREADAQVRAAVERSLTARSEVDGAWTALDETLAGWWTGLAELRFEPAAFEGLRQQAAALAAGGDADLAAAVHEVAQPAREALVRERTLAEEEAARVGREHREIGEEHRRVAAVRELGPEPPRTRQSDRAGRPGAPLYLLCDFAPGVGEAERAGLEAALEAAGLLDAWVMPEGGWLPAGELDTCLLPAALGPAVRTLADVLLPAPGHGVAGEVVAGVLGSIALAAAGEAGGAPWVGREGRFGLGPLQGAWDKPQAEHIGAGAREAARARKLAELAARLAELDLRLDGLASRSRTLGERLGRLDRELQALPSAAALRRAALQAAGAEDDERRRRGEREVAANAAAGALVASETAQQRLAARARELRLAGWQDDLGAYLLRLATLAGRFRELIRAAAGEAAAELAADRARRLLAEAAERAGELRQRARQSATAAVAAQAEVDELDATVGVEAREVVARHQAELARLVALETQAGALAQEVQDVREHRARAAERLALRQGDLGERDEERARAVARLRGVVEAGFLSLVLAPQEEEPAAAWSITRALDLAREIERASPDVDLGAEATSRRVNRLHERYRQLAADLGADFQTSLDQHEDLIAVRVRHNGRDHDIPALLVALRDNAEVRRALLAEHERELLQRFLLGEVGDHLRDRLRQARSLIDDMNELLESCRTASGMALKLSWDPLPEAAPEVREAVRLLRQDLALLADGDRRRLEAFFQGRISEARQHWESVPWRDHLMAALDYRTWHRFRILRRDGGDGGWAELTRRGHGASSGGEKAVALHLPLFAAAAAHYRSAFPAAPRLIALDEAFAGIDQGMRGRCMGLLVAFDLDFVMTSHDEWGCYAELPGVATYQLYRDPALDGVAAVRFVWDGRTLAEDPD